MNSTLKEEVSIVLSGEAGQGIQTIESLLTYILKREGYYVFATKEYMSRIRGGSNSTEIRVSSRPVNSFVEKIDILIPLSKNSVTHLGKRVSDNTFIVADNESLKLEMDNLIDVPLLKIANDLGNPIFANVVAVGVVLGLFGIRIKTIEDYLIETFGRKGKEIVEGNIQAASKGYQIGKELRDKGKIVIDIETNDQLKEDLLLSGTDAVALGALAGGCDSVFAYPMTPGTGVLTAMANFSKDFDIVVEQAEDEIAAINMALGSWYAGGRAMVTTSDGGFALMEEGVSLAGMIESPVVIHLGQRPAPATGLPTRTAQEALNLVIHAGHGEFPRIVYAPGTLEQAFYLTQKAFNMADKYQVPVFILTDQFFVDSYSNVKKFDLSDIKIEKHFVETDEDYKRYDLSKAVKGVSPRGIPNFGKGLIVVDSDEHDEYGHITENLEIRVKMVDKRLKKFEAINDEIISPELVGDEDYEYLIVCWGSNYHVVKEAIESIKDKKIAMLHFSQVFPLDKDAVKYLENAKKVIDVENNATGQFARLFKAETGVSIDSKILKYNGMPFSVEELKIKITEKIEGEL
ncbi:MAG TPA: 2-oxoacid:acceptor oxidoreductase subunit alpha [Defluviitoga tunisiensis]|nr:2-oxoacid:acceptor oxidoreductase subunit alpha [Defluviitoga tunisiensis]HOP25200.1 2-oxoacid:acceptor oxidoreductase subunit alpha [Defluviitoga sp.]HOL86610.1 2-oxoacid:acceptor oxidoreductase subunit alpha [Defluviitoga tunisiensis]HPP10310.1 2-oxoacid:acceptor oxidoreductase subunit alpha [Defluviitoga tunisiensis]HPU60202.1 2-oxoacid:acceptor oxidoreductase subunit alpha [Defluviitoga tunisiensis]